MRVALEGSFPLRPSFGRTLFLEPGYGSPSCQVLRGALCARPATLSPGVPSRAGPSRAPLGGPLCPESLHQHSQGSLETHGLSFLPHVAAPRQGSSHGLPLPPLSCAGSSSLRPAPACLWLCGAACKCPSQAAPQPVIPWVQTPSRH